MGARYSSVSISGYNATPPSDDGSATEANKVKWSTVKTKIGDPTKTAVESINTALVTALNTSARSITASDTAVAGDHLKTIEIASSVTSAVTVTLSDAATMAAGYIVTVSNQSAVDCTIARATGGDTINGTAANVTIRKNSSITFVVNGAVNGYISTGQSDNAVLGAGFTTGDVKLTIKTTADSGWVLMNDGTIGNASSGGTTRANADTEDLFTLLWNNTDNAQCAVSSGRGASAAADYAANKTIALPKALGRALATYGAGSGLTSRAMALSLGHESLMAHTHTGPSHTHNNSVYVMYGTGAGTTRYAFADGTLGGPANYATDASGTGNTGSTGAGNAENMQPTLFLNTMIKL